MENLITAQKRAITLMTELLHSRPTEREEEVERAYQEWMAEKYLHKQA